jgi:hypothetical protein
MTTSALLNGLWMTSLWLALFSVSIMSILIGWRLVSGKRTEARRLRIDATVLSLIEGELTDTRQLKVIMRDADLLAAIIVELSGLIRGREFEDVLEKLKALGAGPRLARASQRGSPESRILAIEALGHLDTRRHRQVLRQIVSSRASISVRLVALSALLGFGESPTEEDLDRLFSARPFGSSFDAKTILSEIAMAEPERLMRRLALARDNETVRAMMLSALGQAGYLPAAELASTLTAHASVGIRRAAYETLGELGMPVGAGILKNGLCDNDPGVRVEAAEAIGRIIMPELAEELARCMADSSWDVRYTAARSLYALGPAGQDCLRYLARVPSSEIDQLTVRTVLKEGLAA